MLDIGSGERNMLDICTVTVRFSRDKGGPLPTVSEVEDWIKDCLNGLDPRNASLTYHKPQITKVEIGH
jgi:hypothetical protein